MPSWTAQEQLYLLIDGAEMKAALVWELAPGYRYNRRLGWQNIRSVGCQNEKISVHFGDWTLVPPSSSLQLVAIPCDLSRLLPLTRISSFNREKSCYFKSYVWDIPLFSKYINKTNYTCTPCDTTIFFLLLYCYWLLVSASVDHHRANIYKKFKNARACSTKTSILLVSIDIHW
jgi:hypothetical protein